jgi:hypothetical protein
MTQLPELFFVGQDLPEDIAPLAAGLEPLPAKEQDKVPAAIAPLGGVAQVVLVGLRDGVVRWAWLRRDDRLTQQHVVWCTTASVDGFRVEWGRWLTGIRWQLNEYDTYVEHFLEWGPPAVKEAVAA